VKLLYTPQYPPIFDISPKKCCVFLAIGLIFVWKFSKNVFFGYWTYIDMEIFKKKFEYWTYIGIKNVPNPKFFWVLDLYRYGNFPKKCNLFLDYWIYIGLISVWIRYFFFSFHDRDFKKCSPRFQAHVTPLGFTSKFRVFFQTRFYRTCVERIPPDAIFPKSSTVIVLFRFI